MVFAEDQHPVGQLGPGGPHEPFRVSVRAGAAGRNLHHGDARVGEHGVEGGGELAGPVPDEVAEPRRTLTKAEEKIPGLLGGPRSVGVGGDAEDVEVAGFYFEGDQHVDPPQGHGVYVEEVDRERRGCLDAQELPPAGVAAAGGCWGYPGPLQDPSDRRGGDPVTELAQLTLDALVPLRRVVPGQPHDQRGDLPPEPAGGQGGSGRSTSARRGGDASAGPYPE